LVSLYSTIKMMHGPINIRFKNNLILTYIWNIALFDFHVRVYVNIKTLTMYVVLKVAS